MVTQRLHRKVSGDLMKKGYMNKSCNPLFLLQNPGAAAGTALQS